MKTKHDGLVLYESTHRYFLDGRELTAVTYVFERTGISDFSKIDGDLLEEAKLLGDCVHELAMLVGTRKLDRSDLDPRLEGYLASIRLFYKENVKKVLLIEKPVCDPHFGYAGKPDLVYINKRDRVVVDDFKTPKRPHPAWQLQTAAYKRAIERSYPEIKIQERGGVQLRPDGTYARHVHKDPQDIDDFLAALRVLRYKQKHKIRT